MNWHKILPYPLKLAWDEFYHLPCWEPLSRQLKSSPFRAEYTYKPNLVLVHPIHIAEIRDGSSLIVIADNVTRKCYSHPWQRDSSLKVDELTYLNCNLSCNYNLPVSCQTKICSSKYKFPQPVQHTSIGVSRSPKAARWGGLRHFSWLQNRKGYAYLGFWDIQKTSTITWAQKQ